MKLPSIEVVLRESPVGDHQANGDAELAVREVKRQVRTLRFVLEANRGTAIREDHPILEWLPQAAADTITRYLLGADGVSAVQRRSGRPWRKMVAEFGEK
eukprot:5864964-Heterocapsa_arctica.AAC.1